MDERIREYLLFRGLNSTLKALDSELKLEKDKGFRVDKVMDQIHSFISGFDINGLNDYWSHLETTLFSHFDAMYMACARKLMTCLLRIYVVTCCQAGRSDRVTEFFERMIPHIHTTQDWRDWFLLQYLKSPEDHTTFSMYFSKQWQDTVYLSLYNFLSVVTCKRRKPALVNYDLDMKLMRRLEEQNISYRQQLEELSGGGRMSTGFHIGESLECGSEAPVNQTSRALSLADECEWEEFDMTGLPPIDHCSLPNSVELMDDFHATSQSKLSSFKPRAKKEQIKTFIKNFAIPASPIMGKKITNQPIETSSQALSNSVPSNSSTASLSSNSMTPNITTTNSITANRSSSILASSDLTSNSPVQSNSNTSSSSSKLLMSHSAISVSSADSVIPCTAVAAGPSSCSADSVIPCTAVAAGSADSDNAAVAAGSAACDNTAAAAAAADSALYSAVIDSALQEDESRDDVMRSADQTVQQYDASLVNNASANISSSHSVSASTPADLISSTAEVTPAAAACGIPAAADVTLPAAADVTPAAAADVSPAVAGVTTPLTADGVKPAVDVMNALAEETQKGLGTTLVESDKSRKAARSPESDPSSAYLLLSQDVYREHTSCIVQCRFSSSGQTVATLDVDGVLKGWSIQPSPVTLASTMSQSSLTALEWAATSDNLLLLGSKIGSVRLFDIKEKKTIKEVSSDATCPRFVCIASHPLCHSFTCSTAGRLRSAAPLADSSTPRVGKLSVWDFKTMRVERSLPLAPGPIAINSVQYDHTVGTTLLTGAADGYIRLFDLRTGGCSRQWLAHNQEIYTTLFNTDQRSCFSLAADGKLLQWSLGGSSSPMADMCIHAGAGGPFVSEGATGHRLIHSPHGRLFTLDSDGRHMLTCANNAGLIYKIDPELGLMPSLSLEGHSSAVICVDWSSSVHYKTCLTADVNGQITVSTLLIQ